MKKLNVGCGKDYKQGYVNLDIIKNLKADVIHNLDKYPWPFKDNTFEEVYMKMVLEHIKEPIKALKEVIRISKNKSKLIIMVPHATS